MVKYIPFLSLQVLFGAEISMSVENILSQETVLFLFRRLLFYSKIFQEQEAGICSLLGFKKSFPYGRNSDFLFFLDCSNIISYPRETLTKVADCFVTYCLVLIKAWCWWCCYILMDLWSNNKYHILSDIPLPYVLGTLGLANFVTACHRGKVAFLFYSNCKY